MMAIVITDIMTNTIPAVIAMSMFPVERCRYIVIDKVSVLCRIPPPTKSTAAKVPIQRAKVIITVANNPCLDNGRVILKNVSKSL